MKKNILLCIVIFLILMSIVACKTENKDTKPYYYNEANVKRYEAYKEKNPKLTEDEIIWHVEADMDKAEYKDRTIIAKEDENNDLILVNKHFAFRKDFKPAKLVDIGNGQKATPRTAKAYREMEQEAQKDGLSMYVASGYRSIALQTQLYNNYKSTSGTEWTDRYSARPQSSEHHTGRALDLVESDWSLENFENTKSCKWVYENAWKYGFILRYAAGIEDITGYAYESWHVTFVGKEAAKTMKEEGIKSFEEYWVKYVKYTPFVK